MDRRRFPRFAMGKTVPSAVETIGARVIGCLVNVSATGCRLSMVNRIGNVAIGAECRIEILTSDGLLVKEGMVQWVGSSELGVKFRSALGGGAVHSIAGPLAGAVCRERTGYRIQGGLTHLIRKDITAVAKPGISFDLSGVDATNSAGLALLHIALDRLARLRNCDNSIRQLLNIAGVCGRCDGCKANEVAP